MTADLKRVHRFLQNTIADPLTAPEAARMAESIRAVFNTNAQVLRFLPDTGEPFSIRDWITGEKQPGSILFITSNYVDLPMNRALLTLWMDLAINRLMTMPRTRELRTWFMFDELGALHKLPAIENGLQTARAFGGAMILGIHSFEKLIEVYGEQGARNLASRSQRASESCGANSTYCRQRSGDGGAFGRTAANGVVRRDYSSMNGEMYSLCLSSVGRRLMGANRALFVLGSRYVGCALCMPKPASPQTARLARLTALRATDRERRVRSEAAVWPPLPE
ncbi:MAG: type IV secretion system DNA-binding domain-containing protein, partial [Sphingomonas sp.]|uniref:type IV secretion system DNA-binding domain-containing protein n=1 Tax=Sphingomonas sp. TaxID=28214 RepID=UPI002614F5FD